MDTFTSWDVIRNLLLSLPWTLILSLIAFLGGGILGLLLLVVRLGGNRFLVNLVQAYVQLFQGTPVLMQIFLVYFGLALFGIRVTPLLAATVCYSLYASAFFTETWYGCVKSIPKGQWEASSSLALSFRQQLRYIIFPVAIRISMPPTIGLMVQIIKNTSLASVIGFVELTRTGQIITNITYDPFFVYGLVALLYFLICFPISLAGKRLEQKFRYIQ
jgi:polar amino acid transport system permease protein